MEKDWRVFTAHRKLILLAKFFLDFLTDLDEDNFDRKSKLKEVLKDFPESATAINRVLDLYDPLNEEFMDRSRKRVLDKANELSREFEADFNRGRTL